MRMLYVWLLGSAAFSLRLARFNSNAGPSAEFRLNRTCARYLHH